jgi:hypothetical protein
MANKTDSALDDLARFVQVVGRDPKLQQWFVALVEMSPVERRIEIFSAAERIKVDRKAPDLAASFRLLADPRVFDAAREALRDCQ